MIVTSNPNTVLSHEEYLNITLQHAKLMRDGLYADKRVAVAKFDTEIQLLTNQMDSITRQLEDHK